VLFFGCAAFSDVANYVDRSFLLCALVDVGGGRSNREAAEWVKPFVETVFLSAAVWAIRPTSVLLRENRLAQFAHDLRLRFAEAAQQRRIGFQDAEFCVVQQHDILNRFERIAPLPV